jgi:hypothetical protein
MIYEENPLHVEIVPTLVPVANEVRIDVAGEPVIDPKLERNDAVERTFYEKVKDYIIIGSCLFAMLILLGAFILFLIWIINQNIFGTDPPEQD